MNITEAIDFYKGNEPKDLIKEFGSPLYVYNEDIFRDRIRAMKNLVQYENFRVHYSAKANSNLALLEIVRDEGICSDAMSPGEVAVQEKAGFTKDEIFYVSNNISKEEMKWALDKGFQISVDSISQLERFVEIARRGAKVSLRLNIGYGVGHHEKVITAGDNTKFGITASKIEKAKEIAKDNDIIINGLNQHLGSLFMEPREYIDGMKELLEVSKDFSDLEFIDFGGGFGIPYKKLEGEKPLDISLLGKMMDMVFMNYKEETGRNLRFAIEPGRYIAAEAGILLGEVEGIKTNGNRKYIGTDIGMNQLIRPTLYDTHHDIEVYQNNKTDEKEEVNVVGNICESGDILAKNRLLPKVEEGDIIGVLDTGAYGYSMSSNYNHRLRAAEVLIRSSGEAVLIRKRENIEDLLKNFISLEK